jgi:hypothetical protein
MNDYVLKIAVAIPPLQKWSKKTYDLAERVPSQEDNPKSG